MVYTFSVYEIRVNFNQILQKKKNTANVWHKVSWPCVSKWKYGFSVSEMWNKGRGQRLGWYWTSATLQGGVQLLLYVFLQMSKGWADTVLVDTKKQSYPVCHPLYLLWDTVAWPSQSTGK